MVINMSLALSSPIFKNDFSENEIAIYMGTFGYQDFYYVNDLFIIRDGDMGNDYASYKLSLVDSIIAQGAVSESLALAYMLFSAIKHKLSL